MKTSKAFFLFGYALFMAVFAEIFSLVSLADPGSGYFLSAMAIVCHSFCCVRDFVSRFFFSTGKSGQPVLEPLFVRGGRAGGRRFGGDPPGSLLVSGNQATTHRFGALRTVFLLVVHDVLSSLERMGGAEKRTFGIGKCPRRRSWFLRKKN